MKSEATSIDITSDAESSGYTKFSDDESYFTAPIAPPSSSRTLQSTQTPRQNLASLPTPPRSTKTPRQPPSRDNFSISDPFIHNPRVRASRTGSKDWEKNCHELAILCEAQLEDISDLTAQCEAQRDTISGLKRKCRAELNNGEFLKGRVESLEREVKRLKEERDRHSARRQEVVSFLERIEVGTRDLLEGMSIIPEL